MKADSATQKTTPRKRRPRKRSLPVAALERDLSQDESLRDMKTWFEENRSLDALALFAKFYERF